VAATAESPNVQGGAHVHNGPVFGSIELGSVVFQVGSTAPRTLTAGDVFYEPAHEAISRWDATEEGVTFLGYFLLGEGETPELTPIG
jgi:quercetin dioxygenase-like cupin family protein